MSGVAIPFIVGCGRSGTTLVRSILDSHPDLAIPGENSFLLEQFDRGTAFSRGGRLPSAEIDALVRASGSIHEALGDSGPLADDRDLTMSEWLHQVYGAYADRFDKARFGDKTPGLVAHIEAVTEQIPDAVIIHIIRDGRDVARAFLDQPWGPDTVARAARTWRRLVTAGRVAGLRLPHRRYLEVRYEDLVADPGAVAVELCAFLDLPYEPAMLEFAASAERARASSAFPDAHPHLDGPARQGLRDWRREMSLRDRLAFELRAGPLLELCGYGPPLATTGVRWIAARARRTRRTFTARR